MNHRSAANSAESPGTLVARSGGGAPLKPTFHCPAMIDTRCCAVLVAPTMRTVTCARPGMTPGSRTLTRTS